ncbi:MAG: inositol monophosphatase family protein [Candidatus Hodarchaeota archaeon]
MADFNEELNLATYLVNVATLITDWFRNEGFESFQKDDNTPVTLADYASQLFIINELKEKFPKDQIIAEEKFNTYLNKNTQDAIRKCYESLGLDFIEDVKEILNYRGSLSSRQWTIDPIDGTKGFQENLTYAVGIGFMLKSELCAAVIGVPSYSKSGKAIFIAEKDQGTKASYGNGNFVSVCVSKEENIESARMCRSLHYDKPWVDDFAYLAKIKRFFQIDSMAKFCMVADGTADLYIKPLDKNRSYSWDFLPGTLIVEEAGGIVSDLKGKNVIFKNEKCLANNPGLIASNGILHEEILILLKEINFY